MRRARIETDKRDLLKRPAEEAYEKRPTKKIYKRNLQKRPVNESQLETYKRDL